MLKKTILYGSLLVVLAGLLSACAPADSPSATIEAYLEALVTGDEVRAVNLSCVSWEQGAITDVSGFLGVDVAIDTVECQVEEQGDTKATVSCSGNLVFTYAGGEDQFIDLSGNQYQVSLEDGEWKMCGYR
ncbi:MAG: hypothetical protein FVQ83_06775 [Chloroflexi bacterium]|nr:hypothetical protein [Chloroflexota bacterium]